MPIRRARRLIALAGLLMAGAVAGVGGCAGSGDTQPGDIPSSAAPAVVPFVTFVARLRAARYRDYAGRSGVAVRDEAAFEEMRRYLLQRYESAQVTASLAAGDAVVDCITNLYGPASRPPATALPAEALPPGGCASGSVPVRRVTLDDLVRFPTLPDFLGKGPGPEGLPTRTDR